METSNINGSQFRLRGKLVSGLQWFWIISWITFISTVVYLLTHWFCPVRKEYQKIIVQFTKQQTIAFNAILAGTDTLQQECDTAQICSTKECIKRFMFISFPEMEKKDSLDLVNYIDSTCLPQLKILLPDYPVKQHSFFWLYSNGIYLELIFWSLFGVLCNLLYYTGEYIRKDEFDNREVFVHVAKMFYSPFCVIIIYLCYNQIVATDKEYDIKYSFYSIAVAFLLGFFSGRMIELLNKIKDVLLPLSTPPATASAAPGATPGNAAKDAEDPNPLEVEDETPRNDKEIVKG